MADFTRREFLKTGLAAGTLAVTGGLPLMAQRQTATDFVTLGRSGVKVTRLAFGTGSFSGQVQRDLGQEGFTRLVRHAYDRGIRFFETAESYGEMHKMLGIALKGIPRESYQLMSKVTTHDGVSPQQKIRRAAHAGEHGVLRHHVAALATHRDLAGRHPPLAGRDPGSRIEEGRGEPRRVGPRPPGAATGPGERVAQRGHDPGESQGQGHGRRGLQHPGSRECPRGRRAREEGSERRNGRHLDEARRRGHIQPRGPAAGDEVRVQAGGRRLRDGRLQEHGARSTRRSRI